MISNRPSGIYEENENFRYTENFIKRAREKIKEFPWLYGIVKDFSDANQNNYDDNYLLVLAARANPLNKNPAEVKSPGIIEQGLIHSDWLEKQAAGKKLGDFNEALKNILQNLKDEVRKDIEKRLKSFDRELNYPLIIEIELYIDLTKAGISNIEYQKTEVGTKTPDFYFMIGKEKFSLELRTLFRGDYQKRLDETFKKVNMRIFSELPEKTYLKLDLKTGMLFPEQNSEEQVEAIYADYKILENLIYARRNSYALISPYGISCLGDPEKTLFECLDNLKLFGSNIGGEIGEIILKLSETKEGKEYLKNTKISDLLQNFYSDFIIRDHITKGFEIYPEPIRYSKSDSSENNPMHERLKELICKKIERGQLRGKTNPLLAVHLQYVITEDYTSGLLIRLDDRELEELTKLINVVFEEKQETEILGVILIEKTLEGAKFIPNKNCLDDAKTAKIKALLKELNIEKKKSEKELENEAKTLEKNKREYIADTDLNEEFVKKFKSDCKEYWNKNQEFLERFLTYTEKGGGSKVKSFWQYTLYDKEWFLDPFEMARCLDKKKVQIQNSSFLSSFDMKNLKRNFDGIDFILAQVKNKRKKIISKIEEMFDQKLDKEIIIKDAYVGLKKLIREGKEYFLFYNSELGKKIIEIPDIKRDPQEGVAYSLEINNSKVYLCLERIENSLLFEKDSFILEQFKEGYESRKEPFVVEVEEFKDKKEIQDIIKSNDKFKTDEDVKQRVKIRIAEKFNIKRSKGASFVRLKV